MELLLLVAGAFLVSAGIAWKRCRRIELPAWTGFVEQRISREMSSIEGRLGGHSVHAAVIYGRERSSCKLRIDVAELLDSRWRFSGNLRTGKVWTHVENRSLPILVSSDPTIRADLHLEIREGTAELDLPFNDPREIYSTVLEILALVRRIANAALPERLRDAFHSASTISEVERHLMLLIEMHPDHAVTKAAVELCRTSGEPALELAAARHFEGERKTALLMRLVESRHASDHVRAEAITLLEPFLDQDRAHAIALRILSGSPSRSRRAALRLLARFPPPEAPERVVEIAQHVQDLGTAKDLVTTLSIIGGARSLRGLEHLLGFADVQAETLAALARLGDRRTLGVIYDHSDQLIRSGLGEATSLAVKQIRERLGAPDGGRLSVIESWPWGEVSLADDQEAT